MYMWASQLVLVVKKLPASAANIREVGLILGSGSRSLGQEDPLEEGMAIYSTILAWRIPWTEEPGGPQYIWSQRVGQD